MTYHHNPRTVAPLHKRVLTLLIKNGPTLASRLAYALSTTLDELEMVAEQLAGEVVITRRRSSAVVWYVLGDERAEAEKLVPRTTYGAAATLKAMQQHAYKLLTAKQQA